MLSVQSVAAMHVTAAEGCALGWSGAPAAGPFRQVDDHWLAADLRLDNREELAERLGARAADLDDRALLLAGLSRWDEGVVDHLAGDFAFAAWSPCRQRLILVRDTAGQRPLHFHRGGNFIAFASMPRGLHALSEVPRAPNLDQLAAFAADIPTAGDNSFFHGISRVGLAEVVRVTPAAVTRRRYWSMPSHSLRLPSADAYAEALRHEVDRATACRMRGAGAAVGAHLSAGLDSGTVAATAARVGRGTNQQVLAFTAAPRLGFADPVLAHRMADESPYAAQVAALYPGMEHQVVRSGAVSPLDLLGAHVDAFQEPVGHPCNFVWWAKVHDAAQARGISMVLTGEAGNLTLSAGSLRYLSEFVRARQPLRWARAAWSLRGTGPSWRGILASSFGPWVPPALWRRLAGAAAGAGAAPGDEAGAFVHPALRARIAARAGDRRGLAPRPDQRAFDWDLLLQQEGGNFRFGMRTLWAIEERDPTADRRLAEFCFSLPVEQLLRDGTTRALARRAFADRLPPAVIGGLRGYQYADWYEQITSAALLGWVARLRAGPLSPQLLDLDHMERLARAWPPGRWHETATIATFRLGLLRALSLGAFADRIADPAFYPPVAAPRPER